jgi:hypothetical protein
VLWSGESGPVLGLHRGTLTINLTSSLAAAQALAQAANAAIWTLAIAGPNNDS